MIRQTVQRKRETTSKRMDRLDRDALTLEQVRDLLHISKRRAKQ